MTELLFIHHVTLYSNRYGAFPEMLNFCSQTILLKLNHSFILLFMSTGCRFNLYYFHLFLFIVFIVKQ